MFKFLIQQYLYIKTQKNYNKKISQIKNFSKDKKIRILFYVTENQKWGYQSLYDLLIQEDLFIPFVVVGIPNGAHKGKDPTKKNLEENYEFFKKRNVNVEYGYKNGRYINLKSFNPDIIFYEQPWGLPQSHKPHNTSKYALCCYVPYTIAANSLSMQACSTFFYSLWKHFVAHNILKTEYLNWMKMNKLSISVTGHPKLDFYNKPCQTESKHYVIYAPHFSIGKSLLKLSTFGWSGQFMLQFAQNHPQINWIFKPHPNLKYHFIRTGYMNEDEIETYFQEWEKISLVHTQGDYLQLFEQSDAMITDCSSFLVEYFLTGKPLIQLINADSVPQNSFTQTLSNNHYKVHNINALNAYLNEILIKKNDFLKNEREIIIHNHLSHKIKSGEKILKELKEELGIK